MEPGKSIQGATTAGVPMIPVITTEVGSDSTAKHPEWLGDESPHVQQVVSKHDPF